jgi:putative FmdB family regulatory protein
MAGFRYRDYQCKACGHRWEVFEPAESDETRKCPKCKAEAMRLFGVPAVIGTDTAYYRGRGTLEKQFGSDHDLKIRVRQAMRHGYRPSPNDVYEPGLAKYIGDPDAFVSGGKNQIKKSAAKLREDVPRIRGRRPKRPATVGPAT